MNIEYFISKRLLFTKKHNNRYTKPILSIAITAISLSFIVMLLSIMISSGFKNNIINKVIGFDSHIVISSIVDNPSFENEPIILSDSLYNSIISIEGVSDINVFATKAGIIKTKEEIEGVVFKGVSSDYDWTFLKDHIISGNTLDIKDEEKNIGVMISYEISKKLSINVDDDLIMYFIQDPPRVIKFKVKGVYNTSLSDFDNLFIIGDIKHIQRLNNWQKNQVGGISVRINDLNQIDEMSENIYYALPYNLQSISIKEKYSQLFAWLELQNINVLVILILMIIVGVINMITALLVIILEKTNLIGILKALGASSWTVRKIFLFNAMYLVFRALVIGNSIALSIAFLQYKYAFIKLDPEIYYMSFVPIDFNFLHIFLLNLLTIIICYITLILPSVIITKISPVKAIRFE
tara:strand:+ start:985 stop:2208 length:1224 start_codon:yes stop_codon:yes gene_type:complete